MTAFIIYAVVQLIKKYGTNDPFELAAALGIQIRYNDLGSLKGYFHYVNRSAFIVINCNLPPLFQRLVCAHELGHFVLHRDIIKYVQVLREVTFFDMKNRTEREANYFLAELLIPNDAFFTLANHEYTYSEIAAELSMPIEIVDIKAQALRNQGYSINPINFAKSNFLANKK